MSDFTYDPLVVDKILAFDALTIDQRHEAELFFTLFEPLVNTRVRGWGIKGQVIVPVRLMAAYEAIVELRAAHAAEEKARAEKEQKRAQADEYARRAAEEARQRKSAHSEHRERQRRATEDFFRDYCNDFDFEGTKYHWRPEPDPEPSKTSGFGGSGYRGSQRETDDEYDRINDFFKKYGDPNSNFYQRRQHAKQERKTPPPPPPPRPKMSPYQEFFVLIGVPVGSGYDVCKPAYFAAMQKYHPDKNVGAIASVLVENRRKSDILTQEFDKMKRANMRARR